MTVSRSRLPRTRRIVPGMGQWGMCDPFAGVADVRGVRGVRLFFVMPKV